MAFKMFLLAFSVLLIVKVTLGKIDCENHPVDLCDRPEMKQGIIPRDVSSFKNYCVAVKSHLSCIKEYQDECGTDRVVFFESSEIFEATFNTISDICEEGTLFNTVATENLKCLNETFSQTRCHGEAEDIVEPLIKANENEDSRPNLSIFCLRSTLVSSCAVRAISNNCGELVGAAALDALRRSKAIENDCSVKGAQSILDDLDNLDLSEAQKRSLNQLLGKFVEENSD